MKRIIIICEGQTEIEFCKDVLAQHFLDKNIFIQTPLIKKSGGGIVPWNNLKKQIENHLIEPEVYVTTFIDYYGIPDNYNYPKWSQSNTIIDKNDRMSFLENEMKLELKNNIRFIPYIQLHEFEGLLFNNIEAFDQHIAPNEFNTREDLVTIINQYSNSEMINNNKETAPSKRLQNHIIGYNKIVYGSILAESIGLVKIRVKSPRFNKWIEILESI
jgi:hypothetical protein